MHAPKVERGAKQVIDEEATAEMVRDAIEHGVNYSDTPFHSPAPRRTAPAATGGASMAEMRLWM